MTTENNKIIVANKGWFDTVPEWLITEMECERVADGFSYSICKPSQEVGDAEVTIYLYTMSLCAPMDYEHSKIYSYLVTQLMRKRKNVELPQELAINELSEFEQTLLKRLKQDLWHKRGGSIRTPFFDAIRNLGKKKIGV